jgi:hypothetical protein
MTITATVVSQPITAAVSGGNAIAANVGSSTFTAAASGGIGPQGPAGVSNVPGPAGATGPAGSAASATTSASDLTSGTLADARLSANVVLTTDSRLSDSRTPISHTHMASQITDFSSAVAAVAPPTTDASLLTSGTLSASRLPASVVLTTDGRLSDARTPAAHSHAVADVTGLQTALDAKQAAGSYAAASHTHTAGQVSGLATVATSGSYADLTNKPTIPAAVTSLPAASITGLATVATSGSYADLSGRPTLFSGSYADLTGVPASFAPSAHNQAWSTITSTPTTLGGYGITDAVGSSDSRLSDARTPTSHTHALSSLTQSSATTGQVVTWNGSAWAAATPAGSSSSLAVYSSVQSFPATGSETTLYLDESSSRLFQWESAVYVEVGASGGGGSGATTDSLHPFLLMGG